jgi:hypothetical protein
LFPYFAIHEGRNNPRIDEFTSYLRHSVVAKVVCPAIMDTGAVVVVSSLPVDAGRLLARQRFRLGWFFHGEYCLEKLQDAAEPAGSYVPLGADWHLVPFPLNEDEWRDAFRAQEVE